METAICLCNMLNTREQSEEKTLLDKSRAKRSPGVFDLPHQLEADSGIFSLGGNGLKSPGRKRDKVIAAVNRDNLIHHPLDIFDCPRELPEQKVNIHGGAAFKICQRIYEQAAFENQVFRVAG